MQAINRKVNANVVSIYDLIREKIAKDFNVDPSEVMIDTREQWSINSDMHLVLRIYPVFIEVSGKILNEEDCRKYDVLIILNMSETECLFDFIRQLKRLIGKVIDRW